MDFEMEIKTLCDDNINLYEYLLLFLNEKYHGTILYEDKDKNETFVKLNNLDDKSKKNIYSFLIQVLNNKL